MGVGWRRQFRTLELDGASVGYVEMGPADAEESPLLLVHGLDGSWRNFLETIPHFARDRRVLALDLPGFGGSPLPEWEISIPAYGRLLGELCDALGLGQVVPVGNSMGGLIVVQAALLRPELIERLALISPLGISNAKMRMEPAQRVARVLALLTPLSFRLREASLRRSRLRDAAFGSIFRHPDRLRAELLWEHFHGAIGQAHRLSPPGFMPAVRAVAGYDIRERLGELTAASLIVWGRDDQLVPAQDATEYARLIPRSQLELFDDCGHLAQLERPLRFNRVLEQFLAG